MRYWLALFTLSALLLGAPATAQTPAAVNGCVYISGGITLSNGQRTAFQCDVNGKLLTTGGGGGGAVSSVSNSDGTLTISPTTGAVVASLALGHANAWAAVQTFNSNIVANARIIAATFNNAADTSEIDLFSSQIYLYANSSTVDATLTHANGFALGSALQLGFSASTGAVAALDTYFTRVSAGVMATNGAFTATNYTASALAGTGSRPICVTSTGAFEAGSLSAGLVTCP